MISNQPWKMFLVTSVLILTALLLGFPGIKVNADEGAPLMPQQGPYLFTGNTSITPWDELAVYQYYPAIALDGSGNAYAIWSDFRDGNQDIYFAYRPAGGSWGVNVKVNDDSGTVSQSRPAIAVDNGGNAFAVWSDSRNGNSDIYFSYRPADGVWGPNVRVDNAPGTSSVARPDIAVDSSGNAYAVWRDSRNGDRDIYFSYRPAGGAWSANVKVNDDVGTVNQDEPAIAVDSSGNAHVLWEDERNGDVDIYWAYRQVSGSWGSNVLVNDDGNSSYQEYPDITVDSTGNAYAVWNDDRDGVYGIYFSYRAVGGNWAVNVPVYSDYVEGSPAIAVDGNGNSYTVWGVLLGDNESYIYSAYRPVGGAWGSHVVVDASPAEFKGDTSLAMSSTGQAFVVWNDYRNDNWDIYFSYHPVSGDWGNNVRVNDDGESPQFDPSLAVSSGGHTFAVWEEGHNGDLDVYFDHRTAGGTWSGSVRVNDDLGLSMQINPAIALDANENAYAIWEDLRNGISDIYFSYRPAGGTWGPNVKVNDDPGGAEQFYPDIAVDGDGNAYAVWVDEREGNDNVYFAFRPESGVWGSNVKVDDSTSPAYPYRPEIAVDGSGNAYVLWRDERNDNEDIYFAYRPDGGTWTANVKINDDVGGEDQRNPDIAVDSSGNAYAVWTDSRDGFPPDIYFAYRPAGGNWAANVKLNESDYFWQSYPSIAVDASGNAYAVWEDDRDGDVYSDLTDIYFSYRPAGGSWGENIGVNLFPGSTTRTVPDIGVDGEGNVYVVWEDWSIASAAIFFARSFEAEFGIYLPLLVR